MTSTELDIDVPVDHRKRLIVGVAIGLLLAIGAATAFALVQYARNAPVTHRYVVPAGTAARIAQGQLIEVLPSDLNVRVGDRLIIKNEDSADFIVGPYTVRRGETLEQTFKRPGEITGECGLTPGDEIRIFIT